MANTTSGQSLASHPLANPRPAARPFLRWAGGKQWLLPTLATIVPRNSGRYFEPFLGAGALFFHLSPSQAFLSDLNPELINAFKQVKEHVDELITRLRPLQHNKKTYAAMAAAKPRSPLSRAARFIYLNRTAWNGLYRVNSDGAFNVPIGRHKYPCICDEQKLRAASSALSSATLLCGDFEHIVEAAYKDDLVYLDPPYATSDNAKGNGFTSYNSSLFSLSDQRRLADVACRLKGKGCLVIVSNTADPTLDSLYGDFNRLNVTRSSRIAGLIDKRRSVAERLYVSFPTSRGE